MRHMGKHFEQLLVSRGIGKSEFGRKIGRSKQWVHEVCRTSNWATSTVMQVADGLGLAPCDLLPTQD